MKKIITRRFAIMAKGFGTVPALSLSHYILSFAPSNHLKLQKLVYYSEGWHLAYFERPLIHENFEAWVHGPVVRSMWNKYKNFNMYTDLNLRPKTAERIKTKFKNILNTVQIELLNDVINEYGDKSAYHLESLSHSELPWKEARNGHSQSERSRAIISKKTMKNYYQTLFSK